MEVISSILIVALLGVLLNLIGLFIIHILQLDIMNKTTERNKVKTFHRVNHDWWLRIQKLSIIPYYGAYYSVVWFSRLNELNGLGYSDIDALLIITKEQENN